MLLLPDYETAQIDATPRKRACDTMDYHKHKGSDKE